MKSNITAGEAIALSQLLRGRDRKVKTSLSISGDLIRVADALAGKSQRSALVEKALRRYLRAELREARDRHDLCLIDRNAETVNREAAELQDIQGWPEE